MGGKGRQGQTPPLPQRLPLGDPGSSKEGLGALAACMGGWVLTEANEPSPGSLEYVLRFTAEGGQQECVRRPLQPRPTWSLSSTPAPSCPCTSLQDLCFLGVLACSGCHNKCNRQLFLAVWGLEVLDQGASRWFLLRPLSWASRRSSPPRVVTGPFLYGSLPVTRGSWLHP